MSALETLVFIAGSGRSGSTMLDLLLNRNPMVQSTGEVHRLNMEARTGRQPCTCGKPVLDCEFWRRVEQSYAARTGWAGTGRPLSDTEIMLRLDAVSGLGSAVEKALLLQPSPSLFRRLVPLVAPRHAEALRQSVLWYEAIAEASGTPIVVDSTKDVRRGKALSQFRPDLTRFIHVMRDGRAVTCSAMRRTGVDMQTAAKAWRDILRRTRIMLRTVPGERKLVVRYEDLCDDPASELARICRFVGCAYSPEMLSLDKRSAHGIGGNPMRFRQGEQAISKDERWKETLSRADLETFDRIAGGINRRYGYPGAPAA